MSDEQENGAEEPGAESKVERAKRSGAADFIAKQFDLEKLEGKLAQLVARGGGDGSPPSCSGGQRSPAPKGPGHGALASLYRLHQIPARPGSRAPAGCRMPATSRRIAPAPPLNLT